MPHLLIEYSGNLISSFEGNDALQQAHNIMLDSGLFSRDSVKSRAHIAADFLIGENSEDTHSSFIHARVYLLAGRSIEQRQALSQAIFESLRHNIPNATHVSVDVREMTREIYQKS